MNFRDLTTSVDCVYWILATDVSRRRGYFLRVWKIVLIDLINVTFFFLMYVVRFPLLSGTEFKAARFLGHGVRTRVPRTAPLDVASDMSRIFGVGPGRHYKACLQTWPMSLGSQKVKSICFVVIFMSESFLQLPVEKEHFHNFNIDWSEKQ